VKDWADVKQRLQAEAPFIKSLLPTCQIGPEMNQVRLQDELMPSPNSDTISRSHRCSENTNDTRATCPPEAFGLRDWRVVYDVPIFHENPPSGSDSFWGLPSCQADQVTSHAPIDESIWPVSPFCPDEEEERETTPKS
jgi:hypothetical protein